MCALHVRSACVLIFFNGAETKRASAHFVGRLFSAPLRRNVPQRILWVDFFQRRRDETRLSALRASTFFNGAETERASSHVVGRLFSTALSPLRRSTSDNRHVCAAEIHGRKLDRLFLAACRDLRAQSYSLCRRKIISGAESSQRNTDVSAQHRARIICNGCMGAG